MSISSTDAQTTASSSSRALPRSPNLLDHGFLHASSSSSSEETLCLSQIAVSAQPQISRSPQIDGAVLVADLSHGSPGSVASAPTNTSRSSKKITEIKPIDGNLSLHGEKPYTPSQGHPAGQTAYPSEEQSRSVGSPESHSLSALVSLNSSSANSSVRKNQMTNANHLLNFHYDRTLRPQPRMPLTRRQHKLRPYDKDLFLQANFKFVVLDSGNYSVESVDPDKMLQWERIICVRYSTPFTVQCPICLESPLCPQITSCGHIFCFPCILRHLMGEDDSKACYWNKCPLCFMMISSKDLYTIYIESVKHYDVGDLIQFTLLTRAKDSLVPSEKNQNQEGINYITNGCDGLCDSFSKFTLTSDVELSVREAYSELKNWLARADSGLVDDLEKLPYVCGAIEQLEQRKKSWTEYQALSTSPPLKNPSYSSACKFPGKTESHQASLDASSRAHTGLSESVRTISFSHKNELKWKNKSASLQLEGEDCIIQSGDIPLTADMEVVVSSSYDNEKSLHRHSYGFEQVKEKDSYTFYQAVDGQHVILHPLNMKCLLNYYGNYDTLPPRISGEIVELETVTQSEAIRRRYRFLSHLSLTTTFQLCEIDLGKLLPPDALSPFMDEIKKRENQRKRLAKKELQEKAKAEAAASRSIPIPSSSGHSSYTTAAFSMEDFEALGTPPLSSTSPPVVTGERKLFSDVTRLGFAAAHDSPSLKVEEPAGIIYHNAEEGSQASALAGQRNSVTLSFANVISAAKSSESVEGQPNKVVQGVAGKKGKKPSRVLMSTAGGRSYRNT